MDDPDHPPDAVEPEHLHRPQRRNWNGECLLLAFDGDGALREAQPSRRYSGGQVYRWAAVIDDLVAARRPVDAHEQQNRDDDSESDDKEEHEDFHIRDELGALHAYLPSSGG